MDQVQSTEQDRGHVARAFKPRAPLKALARSPAARVVTRTWKSVSADNVSLLAAGVAFYALLAIFPALAFFVAMFGLMSDPADVQRELLQIREVLPAEAWSLINTQLLSLLAKPKATLSVASVLSLSLALLNARLAAYSMMSALNVVYKCAERRSFFRINVIALLLTLAAIAILSTLIVAMISVPKVLTMMGLSKMSNAVVQDLRWPLAAAMMAGGLGLTYRFGPDRTDAHWHWLTLGSLLALLLWLLGVSGFSWYVGYFNSFDRLYGSFGALIVLLYWLWVTSFAALMGAELDMQIGSELKRNASLA